MGAGVEVTDRFVDAFRFAEEKHREDGRKSQDEDPWNPTPYIGHPMAVASLVLEYQGSEDQAIAGLLHDTAEDSGGQIVIDEIAERFGPDVARMVAHCSDSLTADRDEKPPWKERKEAYIERMETTDDFESMFVSCADKLHNARSILRDHRRLGDTVYMRFKPGRESAAEGRKETLWYYRTLTDIFTRRLESEPASQLAAELDRTVTELESR